MENASGRKTENEEKVIDLTKEDTEIMKLTDIEKSGAKIRITPEWLITRLFYIAIGKIKADSTQLKALDMFANYIGIDNIKKELKKTQISISKDELKKKLEEIKTHLKISSDI